MATAPDALPRWDLSAYFPSLQSRQFAAAQERVTADVDRLAALYDRHSVRRNDTGALDPGQVAAFDEVIGATNNVLEQLRLLSAYTNSFVTTDARDEAAAALTSELQMQSARVRALASRLDTWIASLGAEKLIESSPVAADHAFTLRKAEVSAAHQMGEAEESLFAELALTGATAWNRLHGDVTSILTGEVEMADGSSATLAMTQLRNLATDADPGIRRRAYEAELRAWRKVEVPCAHAINSIKGEANVVNHRRGWPDPLAPALHANAVDRDALEAMQAAVVESLPHWRRYLRAKAGLLDSGGASGGLPWWDLFAPVAVRGTARVEWDEAVGTVEESFASFSPELAQLARRALDEQWVDAEAREGKRGGAFCMATTGGESRVLLNFGHTFTSVSTLAHELGHAYHNSTLATRTPLQRATPMALAETASIFCETLLTQSVLGRTDDGGRRLSILEYDLQGACQVVVDIHSRFLFERELFDRRRSRTVSPRALYEMMEEAQRRSYDDGLDPAHLHPYMWAVKPHYYSTHFYNWPYTFGLLFGIGLYSEYQEDPDRFRAGYDDLLSATGLSDAAGLAARFGIDIRSNRFWASSLDVLVARIDAFCDLASALGRATADEE